MGDLNARHPLWGDTATNCKGRTIESLLLNNQIDLLNDGSATHVHIQNNSLSHIDLSICSSEIANDFTWKVDDDLYNSDHFPIHLKPIDDIPYIQAPKYIYEKANWKQFSTLAKTHRTVDSFETSEEALQYLLNTILTAADQQIPKSKCGLTRKPVPWWSAELAAAWREKKMLLKRYQQSHLEDHKIAFRRARARLWHLIKTHRNQSWRDFTSSINSKTPINKVWKKVQKIKGKYKPTPMPVLKDDNDNMVTNPKDVANIIGESLSNISKGSTDRSFMQIKSNTRPIIFGNSNVEEYNIPFTTNEYQHALSKTNSSASGEDLIHYYMIKHLPSETSSFILALFNRLWNNCEFPQSWKKALILPFPKAGKDLFNKLNYRPISLTSNLCKIMERMVNVRIKWQLESTGAIDPIQYGFRQGRSTTDVLAGIDTDIKYAFARKQHVIAVFFDIEKAYDTTWRYGILQTLYNNGIRGLMGQFIANFLSDRQFKVKIGSITSDSQEQYEGVPQGSVLSCTLFSVGL